MNKAQITVKVKQEIGLLDFTDTRDINMEDNFVEDLGMDSLDALDLCTVLEREFDLSIDGGEFLEMKTVGDVVGYLDSVINPVGI